MAFVTLSGPDISWRDFFNKFYLRRGTSGAWTQFSANGMGSAVLDTATTPDGTLLFFRDSTNGSDGDIFPTAGAAFDADGTTATTYSDLPDASAGRLSIGNPITELSEEATHDFNPGPITGGVYDEVDYAWRVTVGNGHIGTNGVFYPPAVNARTAAKIRLTATFRGTGIRALNGTSETVFAEDSFDVIPYSAAGTLTAIARGPSLVVIDPGGDADFTVQVLGTATGTIGYRWEVRDLLNDGTFGPWRENANLINRASFTINSPAGTTQEWRVRVTRAGETVTSNTVRTRWIGVIQAPFIRVSNPITTLDDTESYQFMTEFKGVQTNEFRRGNWDTIDYFWSIVSGPGTIDQNGNYTPPDITGEAKPVEIGIRATVRGNGGNAPVGSVASTYETFRFSVANPAATAASLRIVGGPARGRVREDVQIHFRPKLDGGLYDSVSYEWGLQTSDSGTIDAETGVYTPPNVSQDKGVTISVIATFSGNDENARSGTTATRSAIYSFVVYPLQTAPEHRARVFIDGLDFRWRGFTEETRGLQDQRDRLGGANYGGWQFYVDDDDNLVAGSGTDTLDDHLAGSRFQWRAGDATGDEETAFPPDGYVVELDQEASFGEAPHSDFSELDIGPFSISQPLGSQPSMVFRPDQRPFFGNVADDDQPVYLNSITLDTQNNRLNIDFSPPDDATGNINIPMFDRFHFRIQQKANPRNGWSFGIGDLTGDDATDPYSFGINAANRTAFDALFSNRVADADYELFWNRNYPIGEFTDVPIANRSLRFGDHDYHTVYFGHNFQRQIWFGDRLLHDVSDATFVPIEVLASIAEHTDIVAGRNYGVAGPLNLLGGASPWEVQRATETSNAPAMVVLPLPAGTYRLEMRADVEIMRHSPTDITSPLVYHYYFRLQVQIAQGTPHLAAVGNLDFTLSAPANTGERKIVSGGVTFALPADVAAIQVMQPTIDLLRIRVDGIASEQSFSSGAVQTDIGPRPRIHAGDDSFVLLKQVA